MKRETSKLPKDVHRKIELFIDSLDERLGLDKLFWSECNYTDAFQSIMFSAFQELPIDQQSKSIKSSFDFENQGLAFSLFRIATLSFPHSASIQEKQLECMGI